MRILRARAAEPSGRIGSQIMVGGIEIVLSGEDQRRPQAALRQRSRYRGKLDRFGPGADDQPHVRELQLTP
ncbi:MAG TPA: hypothetical protein VMN38_04930 [Sphingomicrobium sp.]|nr:hypothetical protein [Sphingomicrobium sp.]